MAKKTVKKPKAVSATKPITTEVPPETVGLSKFVLTLTEKEAHHLNGINVCQTACERLVKEAIKHYEQAELARRDWWDIITEKYKLDPEQVYQVRRGKFLYTDGEQELHELKNEVRKHASRQDFREFLRQEFGMVDKNA